MKFRKAVAHPLATVNELTKNTGVDGFFHFLYWFRVSEVKAVSVLVNVSPAPFSLLCIKHILFG